MASSAFEELLQTGEPGPVTLDLLRQLVHQVRRTYGFPPPEGYTEWSDDAADDVITSMLTREGEGRKFVTSCSVLAVDEASLERLFLAAIKNFLIDEAKKTPRGKVRRRIARLMSEDPVYRKGPGSPPGWALAEHAEGAIWQGDLDDLIAQAARVTGVGITRWNHSGPTPKQTVHALKTILLKVLQYAQGAVREEDLAKVLQTRFELLAPARFITLYADEGAVSELVEQRSADTADPVRGEGLAEDIWQRLSPNERLLLPYLDEDAHHAAQLLEIRRGHAAAVLSNLKTTLGRALSAETDQQSVMAALLWRCDGAPS
ncbi:hypothetical protein [Kitasatospora purpeofusca]|uniref:hypothetical protein n=1 Tax=Kitasatospora purpeofusca TaxID=67352 RepID=UPI00224D046C|nr:hypothetical protein [Kitasatospora purpeofusca]MCX4758593.1 hypothetical protein [Kitasatospora purpeofusca]WSR30966.1 hypothetical protein OG715_08270 [Kitasatospora purpeofusca]